MNITNLTIHSHKRHNSDCDILVYQIDTDTNITYGQYVTTSKSGNWVEGEEFCETYFGENYNIKSNKKSYSKIYRGESEVPKKYIHIWLELKTFYETNKDILEQVRDLILNPNSIL